MEEGADCTRKATDSARKRTRRRSHTRKSPLSSAFINMAEARREIVNALHLHRSSSAAAAAAVNNPAVLSNQNCYRQLTDAMPIPEPTWSTTAPAVLCAPAPPVELNLEVEWFDYFNLSASHSWWIGFLNSLDGKNGANQLRGDAEGLGPCLDDSMNVEKSASSSSDGNDQSLCMDDWLIFPAAEECGEQL